MPGDAAQRMTTLARLALTRGAEARPRVLVASVSALTQRVPPRAWLAKAALSVAAVRPSMGSATAPPVVLRP